MQGRTDPRVHAFGAVVLVACALFGAGVVRATDEPATTKSSGNATTTATSPKPAMVATTTSESRPRNTKLPVMYVPPEKRAQVTASTPKPASATTPTIAAKGTATGRSIAVANSKDYGLTVAASRSTAPKPAPVAPKPVTVARKPASVPVAPVAKSMPSTAERMSKSSVARPVVTSGPKATATPPPTSVPTNASKAVPAASSARPNVAAAKPVVSPAKQSLAASQASQPGWSFRNTQAGGGSTTKVVATTVAGGPPAATLATATKSATKVAAKPVAKPAAPVTVAVKPAAVAPKPTAVATKPVAPATIATKSAPKSPPTVAARPMPGVQVAGSSTASMKPAAKPVPKPTLTPAQVAAKTGKKGVPIVPAVQTLGAAFMEQREMYVYNSLDRRDPFQSLVSGAFEGTAGTPLLDVSSMKLVGIVWGGADKFALVEDSHGHGYVLRVGDPVLNGYIAGLTKEELIVKQSSYGDTQTVTIQLQRKDGVSNAN